MSGLTIYWREGTIFDDFRSQLAPVGLPVDELAQLYQALVRDGEVDVSHLTIPTVRPDGTTESVTKMSMIGPGFGEGQPAQAPTPQRDPAAEHAAREAVHEATSADVGRTLDHLRNNRTTEREAVDLRDAAIRSLTDHCTAKSLKRD